MRVLVVDDDPDQVMSLMALVRLQGYEPHGQHDAMQIVDCIREFDPDAVILDIGLPGKNGFDAAREIRAAIGGRRPLLIGLSGQYIKTVDRLLASPAGFDHYLVKPAEPQVLLDLLKSAEDAKRQP
jgi:DNA-binding response OmpR family regulator